MEIYFNEEVIWLPDDAVAVVAAFFSEVKIVPAAGGLVRNGRGDLLCIYRWNRWDLPKGKVEGHPVPTFSNHSLIPYPVLQREAAREVREETGLTEVEVGPLQATTYHVYLEPDKKRRKGEVVVKITWWFAMKASGDQPLIPQTKEGITGVRWFPVNELNTVENSTYRSLREMIQRVRRNTKNEK